MIYALLDESRVIRPAHLGAALAVWQYAEQSAGHIFGKSTGDKTSDKLLAAFDRAPDGLTQTQIIEDVFCRNLSKEKVSAALSVLVDYGLVTSKEERSDSNRLVIRWRLCPTSDELDEASSANHIEDSSNSYLVRQTQGRQPCF